MLMRARIELTEAGIKTPTRELFWNEFQRLAGTESSSALSNPQGNERALYQRLPSNLEDYLNGPAAYGGLRLRSSFARRVRSVFGGDRVQVKIKGISYGSLDALLEIVGVSRDTAQDTVLSLLEIYLPVAVNDVFNTTVSMDATVTSVGDATIADAGRAARIQRLITSTLLLPLGLALGVCYLVFFEMRKEMDSLKAREDKLITEASSMFGKLLEQNASLSKTILERAQDENKKLKDAANTTAKLGETKP
jgi:hypothetical protein